VFHYKETIILPYTDKQLFKLVISVENYSEFLPWCIDSEIIKKRKKSFDADLIIGYNSFNEVFRSRVSYLKPQEINVEMVHGPFKYMRNLWNFKETRGDQCELFFEVEFEFDNKFFELILGSFFKRASYKMVKAFEERARSLYL